MEYLGAWGTLIHEKNLKSKISSQTPFKIHHKRDCEYIEWSKILVSFVKLISENSISGILYTVYL